MARPLSTRIRNIGAGPRKLRRKGDGAYGSERYGGEVAASRLEESGYGRVFVSRNHRRRGLARFGGRETELRAAAKDGADFGYAARKQEARRQRRLPQSAVLRELQNGSRGRRQAIRVHLRSRRRKRGRRGDGTRQSSELPCPEKRPRPSYALG